MPWRNSPKVEQTMKQILQSYSTGKIELADAPVPACSSNNVLVRNVASLISIGTERSIIELGKKSLLGKARARPDLVKRFIEKAQNEGFVKTFKEALGRLDNPTALRYSCAGLSFRWDLASMDSQSGTRLPALGPDMPDMRRLLPSPRCCAPVSRKTFHSVKLHSVCWES